MLTFQQGCMHCIVLFRSMCGNKCKLVWSKHWHKSTVYSFGWLMITSTHQNSAEIFLEDLISIPERFEEEKVIVFLKNQDAKHFAYYVLWPFKHLSCIQLRVFNLKTTITGDIEWGSIYTIKTSSQTKCLFIKGNRIKDDENFTAFSFISTKNYMKPCTKNNDM